MSCNVSKPTTSELQRKTGKHFTDNNNNNILQTNYDFKKTLLKNRDLT